jgi:LuxR family transcriptional regulator, maltose regulon positive regulatory protein
MVAAHRTGPANRHRAGHQAAAAPSDREAPRRPRPLPRVPGGVQRGRTPAIAAGGIPRAGDPGDRLDPDHPGPPRDARAALAALTDEQANSGEIRNARAAICLTEGDPAGALGALADVLDGTAPVIGYITVVEAQLLAALAHRALGDQNAANTATERALALAEPDRLVLPFVTTGAQELLEALPRHATAHAALLADILDVVHGASLTANNQSPSQHTDELSPSELRVLRYLPTNLSRPEIASQLSVSVNTVNTHIRSIYAKLQASNRSSAVQRARELRLLAAGRTR